MCFSTFLLTRVELKPTKFSDPQQISGYGEPTVTFQIENMTIGSKDVKYL